MFCLTGGEKGAEEDLRRHMPFTSVVYTGIITPSGKATKSLLTPIPKNTINIPKFLHFSAQKDFPKEITSPFPESRTRNIHYFQLFQHLKSRPHDNVGMFLPLSAQARKNAPTSSSSSPHYLSLSLSHNPSHSLSLLVPFFQSNSHAN